MTSVVDYRIQLNGGTINTTSKIIVQTHARLAADAIDHSFFITPNDAHTYTVTAISASWGTADSTATTATLMVERCQGTEAPGSGDDLLASAIDASATANTVVRGTLTSTTANLTLAQGDRLALDVINGATELADLTVTVEIQRSPV